MLTLFHSCIQMLIHYRAVFWCYIFTCIRASRTCCALRFWKCMDCHDLRYIYISNISTSICGSLYPLSMSQTYIHICMHIGEITVNPNVSSFSIIDLMWGIYIFAMDVEETWWRSQHMHSSISVVNWDLMWGIYVYSLYLFLLLPSS